MPSDQIKQAVLQKRQGLFGMEGGNNRLVPLRSDGMERNSRMLSSSSTISILVFIDTPADFLAFSVLRPALPTPPP